MAEPIVTNDWQKSQQQLAHLLFDSRDRIIYQRRLKGETLQSIGNDYGICRERVNQIIKKMRRKKGGEKNAPL